MNRARRDTILGLTAVVLWSTAVPFGRSQSEKLGTMTAGATLFLVSGSLVLAWQAARGGFRRTAHASVSRRYLFVCGGLFVAYVAFLFAALGLAADRQQALEVGLFNYLWPTLTLLLAVPIQRYRGGKLLLPGAALATAGVCLATLQSQPFAWEAFRQHLGANPLAYLFATLGALAWALYSNFSKRWAARAGGGGVAVFMLASGLTLFVLRLGFPETTRWSAAAVVELAFIGIVTALAYAFWDYAMRGGDMILVGACSYFTPLLATGVGALYLRVRPGAMLWVACALVIAGALLSQRGLHEAPPPPR